VSWSAFLVEQHHHHQHLLRAGGEVHGANDGGNRVGRPGVLVDQVTVMGHLGGAEDADVQVAAAHHRERVRVVE
jgi:hypothetical protein